jgi:ADP-ribose pyrophosphatase
MSDEHLREDVVARRLVHEGKFMRFRLDTIRGPDGREHSREIVDHPGAVAVLPLLGDELLLVRQWRLAADRAMLEIPAGTLDRRDDGTIEPPDEAAPRELAEETGHTARTWRKLGRFWTAPGFATEEMHLYLATDLVPVEGYAGPEPDERLDLVRVPWRDAVDMVETGGIVDAKTLVGLLWLARLSDRGELDGTDAAADREDQPSRASASR